MVHLEVPVCPRCQRSDEVSRKSLGALITVHPLAFWVCQRCVVSAMEAACTCPDAPAGCLVHGARAIAVDVRTTAGIQQANLWYHDNRLLPILDEEIVTGARPGPLSDSDKRYLIEGAGILEGYARMLRERLESGELGQAWDFLGVFIGDEQRRMLARLKPYIPCRT